MSVSLPRKQKHWLFPLLIFRFPIDMLLITTFTSPRSYTISKASEGNYSKTCKQGKDEYFCSIVWMQQSGLLMKSARTCNLGTTAILPIMLMLPLQGCPVNQDTHTKKNKGIKKNLRRYSVFCPTKSRTQTMKATVTWIHTTSPLFPYFSSTPAPLASPLTSFYSSFQSQFVRMRSCVEYVEVVQHGRHHVITAEQSLS